MTDPEQEPLPSPEESIRSLQSPGVNSKVYVPILLHIFRERYTEGCEYVDFTLDDIREVADFLGIQVRNAADVVYRMRSRTVLPPEITDKSFLILKQTGRGKYRLEKGTSTLFEVPEGEVLEALDITPLPVRRLLPAELAKIDEQGLLTVVNYRKILDHFTGLRVYRLRTHFRRSVLVIGQVELDALDVGVALSDDEKPILFPVEAKAVHEPINRVQIAGLVQFCDQYFPNYEKRPIVVKVDHLSCVHVLEFSATTIPAELVIVKASTYRIRLSETQMKYIAESEAFGQ